MSTYYPYELFYIYEMEISLKCRTIPRKNYMCVNDICETYCKPMQPHEMNKLISNFILGHHVSIKKKLSMDYHLVNGLYFISFMNMRAFLFHCLHLNVFYREMQHLVSVWKQTKLKTTYVKPSNDAIRKKPLVKKVKPGEYFGVKKPSFK